MQFGYVDIMEFGDDLASHEEEILPRERSDKRGMSPELSNRQSKKLRKESPPPCPPTLRGT